jgi:outer membrane protein assembly factor BamB
MGTGVGMFLMLMAAAALAADWPQFRGPSGTGISTEKGLPIKWSTTENVRWKAELPGRGLSCPVVANGRAYVTACSGYQQDRLHVLCFEAATGEKLWERQLWGTGSTTCHPTTCMAAPTPAADSEGVCVLFATSDAAAFDRDGNLLWYRSLVRDYPGITNNVGMAASPVLWKDLLFLPLENAGVSFAAALDRKTGRSRWKVARHKDINWITPLVVTSGSQPAVLFQTEKEITAYDPQSGQQRWTHAAGGLSPVSSPTLADGQVLVAGGEFTVLKASGDSATPEVVWKSNKIKTHYSSAVYHAGRIYAINSANILNCYDASDGNNVWQQRLKGPFWASPVIADGKLYAVNEEGITFVVDLAADDHPIVSENPIGEKILATPALANGSIYLRSDQHLFCLGAQSPKR